MSKRTWLYTLLILSLMGMADAFYLTWEHFQGGIAPCAITPFPILNDCGKVLRSQYSVIGPIPLALLGLFYYTTVFGSSLFLVTRKTVSPSQVRALFLLTCIGILTSSFLVYLQLFVIQAICMYCMLSAFLSTLLFLTSLFFLRSERSMKE
ncbi:MAG TPA: vitamin K epoxide reductase family protein [Patescibacteria group bacterium]|nr:vitamin K epoxide reductase family protein [Patescibacteria group bacterium]